MTAQLDGSTALVTGGNSGVGRAIALDLAAHGAHVIVSGRDTAPAEEVVATIRANDGKADFITTGLADEASARELARRATELGGGHIDILVNNAGIYPFRTDRRRPPGRLRRRLQHQRQGAVLPRLRPGAADGRARQGRDRQHRDHGRHYGEAGYALYGSSKAAVLLLTKAWAAEYGPSGVRVNAINPGPTRTEGTSGFGDALDRRRHHAARPPWAARGDRGRGDLPRERRRRLHPRSPAPRRRWADRRLIAVVRRRRDPGAANRLCRLRRRQPDFRSHRTRRRQSLGTRSLGPGTAWSNGLC
jgi:NAD(P)-dependent dehydrogenase (short-subunit alcohol dehydrogenase family)